MANNKIEAVYQLDQSTLHWTRFGYNRELFEEKMMRTDPEYALLKHPLVHVGQYAFSIDLDMLLAYRNYLKEYRRCLVTLGCDVDTEEYDPYRVALEHITSRKIEPYGGEGKKPEPFTISFNYEDAVLTCDGMEVIHDPVNHPAHYTKHPSGVECIEITRHMNFNIGNAIKYLWRSNDKGQPIQDLEKAVWYINDEIERRKK